MAVPWTLLWILGLICSSDSGCSPTSYYKSCWIRRYPGLYVDIEESQRRGAHVLKLYQEESALKCSRACCLTRNFSCNLAVFHFNTTQDSVNCFHLQCPNLESCIPHHRGNVILYNVTKGVDPDLLVFGKYFTTNVRVLPHMSSSRLNISEPLTSDKRQFNYPPNQPIRSITTPQQTTQADPTAHQVQHTLPRCTTIQATTAQSTSERVISTTPEPKIDSTLNPQQMMSTSQRASINPRHTTTSPTGETDTTTDTSNQRKPTPPPFHLTTAHPSSETDYFDSTLTSIPIDKALRSSTTRRTLGEKNTAMQNHAEDASETLFNHFEMAYKVVGESTQSSSSSTTLGLKTSALENTKSLETASEKSTQSSSSSTTLGLKTSALENTKSLETASEKSTQSSSSSTTLGLKTSALENTNSLETASEKSMQSSSSSTTSGLKTTGLQNTDSLAMASQDPVQSLSSSTTQQSLGLQTSTVQTTNSLASQKSMQSFTKILTSTRTTEQATSLYTSKLDQYPKTTVQTTVIDTRTHALLQSEMPTTTKPLISANVPLKASTQITVAHKTIQAQSTNGTKTSSIPYQTTITKWTTTDPLQASTQTPPAYKTSTWPSQTPTRTTTLSQPKETTSSNTRTLQISTITNPTITTGGSTNPRHLTLSFTHTRTGNFATTGSLSSSLTAPTSSMVDSQPYPNDTKGYISRNITTGDTPRPGGDGNLMSVWHLAANTVLVALATCATITFCCCCSVFAALSWRGRRRRKGRYRTNLRCKRGSMRLIKYVIVRESS
ncbi:cell wall protein DAN4-like [Puntigrus tetrazona]|uniref:cell wall protein DAN4-like n=1 Tax=Puntigrus tetrazona TaxID=1606681 RepID=UPI001C898515|nr:cell wall protein DAN4-like [Puntigrus tetrazona]